MSCNIAGNAVKIAVRQRPARENLDSASSSSVITCLPNGKNIIVNEAVFTFDHVLGPTSTQKEIFDELIKPLVAKLKLGFNCTALAYGQTGTGKSYTMGLNSNSFDGEDVGVIPRSLNEIFSLIGNDFENGENSENIYMDKDFEIFASFIEIYNEKVYDLLGENPNEPIVARGYKYTGGTQKQLKTLEDCYAILMQGNKNRHVRPTKINSQSSRSHAIFTIHILSRSQKVNGEEIVTKSCMNIVDLAGSEGVRRTGHQGIALSEGVHINQGLLSIGKVLQAMTAGSKVIPYRDSVLSSVLQESLNSNSFLTLLACVSPHREDLSETLSTLRFAQNAKQLKNTPEINNIIADIRKNAKLKQTPYKVKPMQQINNRKTPLKRSHSKSGIQAISAGKSHTFCTPKKKKMEVNKCNLTEISNKCIRPKLSNAEMNLPTMNQLESTHNHESWFNRTSESNGSLLSLNISSSTSINGHANQKNKGISPIIRKCMTELKADLEENLFKVLQTNLKTLVCSTPAPKASPKNQTILPATIRQELKTIMKEVLFENSEFIHNPEEKQNTQIILQNSAKCQLFNGSDGHFKIPEIPLQFNGTRTSSPVINVLDSPEETANFAQTFFSSATNSDKTIFKKPMRRSCRISEKQRTENPILSNANQSLRRSSRKSVLQMYKNKRESICSAKHNKSIVDLNLEGGANDSRAVNKAKKLNSTSTNTKTSLTSHRKAVLELLNKGSMKELQILPQIGQKTAYQIVTQRTLNGKFKSWLQVEKLPIWRGTSWQRFAQANMIT